ncbi:hypothetical protein C8D87_101128 [Lentzea atacamensis]|uniref:Uncharacterized protein n=1 Tax=Lentzea atacamensis TaxID=531938 RepID=A0ABX9EFP6_9PSEU|nr:hypothetical protein C8D87_101128 [Lentzea atacamensis]
MRELVATHWWRTVPAVAAVIITALGDVSMSAVLPTLVWCVALARTRRTGLIVGLVLLGSLEWFVAPRVLWWSGPWVPSPLDLLWLYPLLAALVCETGAVVERRQPAGVLTLLAVVTLGLLATGIKVLDHDFVKPESEGVLPGPSGVRVVEGDGGCGYCWRDLDATGDRAGEVMRAHLTSRGFTPASPLGAERMCRHTGVFVPYVVCAELRDRAPGSVRVTWYVE